MFAAFAGGIERVGCTKEEAHTPQGETQETLKKEDLGFLVSRSCFLCCCPGNGQQTANNVGGNVLVVIQTWSDGMLGVRRDR